MTLEEILKKVRAIELGSRRQVKEKLSGDYKSAYRGSGMQFKEFRDYVYGDDVRHISWNVSARTRDPVLKIFEEERDRVLFLIVDVSASLRKGPWAVQKAQKLAEVAAILSLSAHEAKDKFGLLLFSDRIETVVPPSKGKTHLLRVIKDVLAFNPVGQKTSPGLALKRILGLLKKRSIVFLLSDLEVLPDEKILRRISKEHDFTAIHVEHPSEWNPPAISGFAEVESAEQGRPVTLDISNASFLRFLNNYGQSRRNTMDAFFKKCGAELLHLSTTEEAAPLLSLHFKKSKSAAKKGANSQKLREKR